MVEWEFDTPVEITDTLTLVNLADKVAVMFDAVGLPSKKFVDFREDLVQKFRKKYIRSGKLTTKTQTALAMALQNGVFSDDESNVAYAELLDDIHAQNDHFRVGVVGYKYLFETLAEHGDQNLCSQTDYTKQFSLLRIFGGAKAQPPCGSAFTKCIAMKTAIWRARMVLLACPRSTIIFGAVY